MVNNTTSERVNAFTLSDGPWSLVNYLPLPFIPSQRHFEDLDFFLPRCSRSRSHSANNNIHHSNPLGLLHFFSSLISNSMCRRPTRRPERSQTVRAQPSAAPTTWPMMLQLPRFTGASTLSTVNYLWGRAGQEALSAVSQTRPDRRPWRKSPLRCGGSLTLNNMFTKTDSSDGEIVCNNY